MTREEHVKAHMDLHKSFDLLLADFLQHNPGRLLSNTTLMELMKWSHQETENPTLLAAAHYDEDLTEGDRCPFAGCDGRMGFQPVENCSCHISPPCNQCVDNPLVCLKCDWRIGDPTGPPSMLEVCKTTLQFFYKARAEEGDPLRAMQDKFHGPIRELLETAIAREEGHERNQQAQ